MKEETDNKPEYSTYMFFSDGSHTREASFVLPEEAMRVAHGIISSVGGRAGLVARVIITDGGDAIVFEWSFQDGITWPPHEKVS